MGTLFCKWLRDRKDAAAPDSKEQPARMLVLDCLGNLLAALHELLRKHTEEPLALPQARDPLPIPSPSSLVIHPPHQTVVFCLREPVQPHESSEARSDPGRRRATRRSSTITRSPANCPAHRRIDRDMLVMFLRSLGSLLIIPMCRSIFQCTNSRYSHCFAGGVKRS